MAGHRQILRRVIALALLVAIGVLASFSLSGVCAKRALEHLPSPALASQQTAPALAAAGCVVPAFAPAVRPPSSMSGDHPPASVAVQAVALDAHAPASRYASPAFARSDERRPPTRAILRI